LRVVCPKSAADQRWKINAEKKAGKKSEERRGGGGELTVSRQCLRLLATDCSVGGDYGGGGKRRRWKEEGDARWV